MSCWTLSRHPFRMSLALVLLCVAPLRAGPPAAVESLAQEVAALRSELAAERARNQRMEATVEHLSVQLTTLGAAEVVEREKAQTPTVVSAPGIQFKVGGQYRVLTNNGNFTFHQAVVAPTNAPFPITNPHAASNLRLRNNLEVRADGTHGAFFQYEIGHVDLAANGEFPKAAGSPGNPFQQAGDIEVRRAYLFEDRADKGLYRFGILDYTDPYGSFLASADWDFNVGGFDLAVRLGGDTREDPVLRAGLYQLLENNIFKADDTYMGALDVTWSKDASHAFGVALNYMDDSGQYSYAHRNVAGLPDPRAGAGAYLSSHDTWYGVHGKTKLGNVDVNGALIGNSGTRLDPGPAGGHFDHDGSMVRVEGSAPVLRDSRVFAQALHSTGEADPNTRSSGEFRTIAQSVGDNFGAESYWGYLSITSPHGPSDLFDLGVSPQNRSLGLNTVQAKLDTRLSKNLGTTLAVGYLKSDATNPANGGNVIGTEIRGEVLWRLGRYIVMQTGAAALKTGNFYKVSATSDDPANLYQIYSRTQMEF